MRNVNFNLLKQNNPSYVCDINFFKLEKEIYRMDHVLVQSCLVLVVKWKIFSDLEKSYVLGSKINHTIPTRYEHKTTVR